jgi:hypothetical protein
MTKEQRTVRSHFAKLLHAKRERFPGSRKRLLCSRKQGVYVIFDRVGRVAHVGRTTRARAGLFQRLRAHLAGRSSFVIKFLGSKPARLRQGYCFAFVEIGNSRMRALVEA